MKSGARWWTILFVLLAAKAWLLGTWLLGDDPGAHAEQPAAAAVAKPTSAAAATASGGAADVEDVAAALPEAQASKPEPKPAAAPKGGGLLERPSTKDIAEAAADERRKHAPKVEVGAGVHRGRGAFEELGAATPRACLAALSAVEAERRALARRESALAARERAVAEREARGQRKLALALALSKKAEAAVERALRKRESSKRDAREKLAKLMGGMKPKEAAAVVGRLAVPLAVETLGAMAEVAAAKILAQIPAERAAEIGEALLVGKQKAKAAQTAAATTEAAKSSVE